MAENSHDLARRLAERAEAVCRHYLSNGKRYGRYWMVGDARNTPGRSLYVRLLPSDKGPAGKWTDAATGEHGDLLDIIRESCGLSGFVQTIEEAARFLGVSTAAPMPTLNGLSYIKSGAGVRDPDVSQETARRLFAISHPIIGTLAQTYLRHRGITALFDTESLRFHPRCYYRPDDFRPVETWPAMIAAVTDLDGRLTGIHRTWLALDGIGKAPVATPRRAMGSLLGHAVRFGTPDDVMAIGEGIETVLSLRCAFPLMPMAAALSATHLAAICFPPTLRRLYLIHDRDPAGDAARDALTARARAADIGAIVLSPQRDDFNDDLQVLGIESLRTAIAGQLLRRDRSRYLKRKNVA
ncbi:DUF7146 domain-containing protein [Pelagibacterium lacus]|uniref:DNA primase n=1 Tax=Pelagibacterium lacus TaxID=2282655 RepID=A0A369W1G7_9HYPH|nr:toprim domain-containing protein [Pelagibacterium lacus]RDE07797.1 DNA primase [Pelagibacterium lacus]